MSDPARPRRSAASPPLAQQQASKAVRTQLTTDGERCHRSSGGKPTRPVSHSAQQAVSDIRQAGAAASAQQQARTKPSATPAKAGRSFGRAATGGQGRQRRRHKRAANSAAAKTQQQVSKVVSGATGTMQAPGRQGGNPGMKQDDQARADAGSRAGEAAQLRGLTRSPCKRGHPWDGLSPYLANGQGFTGGGPARRV